MIAATVLLIATGGTLITHLSSRNLIRTAQETDAATTALRSGMEEILISAREDIPTAFPTGQALALEDFGLEGLQVVPSYPNFGGATIPVALEIQLEATWTTFDRGQRSIQVTTVKGR